MSVRVVIASSTDQPHFLIRWYKPIDRQEQVKGGVLDGRDGFCACHAAIIGIRPAGRTPRTIGHATDQR